MAVGAMRVLKERGLLHPSPFDVAVVGFEDSLLRPADRSRP